MVKETAKAAIRVLACLLVMPLALPEHLLRRLLHRDVLFFAQSQWLSLMPGKTGSYLRNAYYHLTLRSCPFDCNLSFGMLFTHSNVSVGHRIYVGSYSRIGLACIGDDTMIADNVHILSGAHQHGTDDPNIPFQQQEQHLISISIGRNAWIGTGSVVMSDIGNDSVIGAGSVVNRPIPDGCVAVGVPARAIKNTRQ